MRCYHITTDPPTLPVAGENCQWLSLGSGMALTVHDDCHHCKQPDTRLPHLLHGKPVGADHAALLAKWGVLATDTHLQAMLKVAEDWAAAWP